MTRQGVQSLYFSPLGFAVPLEWQKRPELHLSERFRNPSTSDKVHMQHTSPTPSESNPPPKSAGFFVLCAHLDCEIVVGVVGADGRVTGKATQRHGAAANASPPYCSRHNQPWKRGE